MLHKTHDNASKRFKRQLRLHIPLLDLENPVKRYLGDRGVGHRRFGEPSQRGWGRLTMRLAM
ncbi:MAG: hypothetical protein WBM90_02935 [Acidimicrobiia bacterium]